MDEMMMSVLNRPQVDMSLHSGTLSWFQTETVLLLLHTESLGERQHIPVDDLWFDQTRAQTTIYDYWGEFTNHYTTNAVKLFKKKWMASDFKTIDVTRYRMPSRIYLH